MDVRRLGLSLLLLTGTASADPIPELEADGVELNPDPKPSGGCSCEVSAPTILTIRGTVYTKSSAEPAAGATIVVSAHGGKDVYTALSDERGEYKLEVQAGHFDVTLYYLETTLQLATNRLITADTQLDPAVLDDTRDAGYTCWYISPFVPSVGLTSMPRFGAALSRQLQNVSRDRTHRAWISPVAFADPARTATTVEGGRRFTTAPGIPLMFVEDVTTYSLDVPIGLAQAGGGATDVSLRAGSNEKRGDARVILGADRRDGSTQAETFLGGPIAKDHAWAAGGLVMRRDAGRVDGAAMLRLDGKTDNHDVMVAGLGHDAGGEQAGWSAARWKARMLDGKLEVGALVTTELLEQPLDVAARETTPAIDPARHVDRTGGTAFARFRFKGAGRHIAYASAGGGVGMRDGLRHTDTSYAIGDEWNWTPALVFTAGVRAEQRTLESSGRPGDMTDRATVVAPRASLKWDPTDEGRSEIFAAYQRVPLVDDGLPGDFKSLEATYVDELSAGVSYGRSSGNTMAGLAVRQRADRTGADAWVRRDTSRSVVLVQATSLERVATVLAQRKLRDREGTLITAGAAARVAEDRSEAGVALGWKRSPGRRETTAEIAAEGYAGTAGPGGRIVVGILW